jgi:F-type H+-transporting ATPase subunit a
MIRMYTNPLEQFEVIPLIPLEFSNGYLDFTVSNFVIFLFLNFFLVVWVLLLAVYKLSLIPTRLQSIIEELYLFVVDTVKQQAGVTGAKFSIFFFTVFFFILIANLLGLVPFCFTTTSHIIMVSFIALVCNVSFIIIGFNVAGLKFLLHFVPSSAPKPLIPLITVIEVASYLIRTLSLSLRLFANMMAGHILLFILATFVAKMLYAGQFFLSFLPLLIMIGVFVLETGICFIQAYVFLVLLSIYLNESLHVEVH